MKLITIFFLSLLIIYTSCNGQNTATNEAKNEKLLTRNLGDTVTAMDKSIMYILQDKNNNYWFGSFVQGLYRYDGKTLLHFTSKDGLLDNQIRGIQEDKFGNIFISSLGGINKYDGQEFIALAAIESNEWKLEPNDLWFSTLGNPGKQSVYRYDGNNLYHLNFPKHHLEDEYTQKYPNAGWSPYEVYNIYKDKQGHIWFGTANLGIGRYDGQTLSWMYEDHLTNTPSGASFGIRSMFEDSQGDFWFCNTRFRYTISSSVTTENGINYINYKRSKGMGTISHQNQESFPYFFSIVEDKKGNLWSVTYDQGVLQYNGKKITQYLIKDKDTVVNIFSIYKDNEDSLWLGTHNAGVYKFNGTAFEQFKP